jgi:hypothetical protein
LSQGIADVEEFEELSPGITVSRKPLERDGFIRRGTALIEDFSFAP